LRFLTVQANGTPRTVQRVRGFRIRNTCFGATASIDGGEFFPLRQKECLTFPIPVQIDITANDIDLYLQIATSEDDLRAMQMSSSADGEVFSNSPPSFLRTPTPGVYGVGPGVKVSPAFVNTVGLFLQNAGSHAAAIYAGPVSLNNPANYYTLPAGQFVSFSNTGREASVFALGIGGLTVLEAMALKL
jgi:hypothetical protein